jgi:uncharacterized repeat protein (TIGR03806 family)
MARNTMAWLVLWMGCTDKDDKPDAAGTDADADVDADADSDSDTDTDLAEFGLDTRPLNTTCVAPDRPLGGGQARVTRVFSGISHSEGTMMLMAPGDTSQWYLIERAGYVWRFDDDPGVGSKTLVMDFEAQVSTPSFGSEMGLLGMAFHPDFQNNHELFLYYSAVGGEAGHDHESHLSRFTSTDGGLTFDPASEELLLVVSQPYSNHNGGTILFGSDGYLYLGLGDGGSGGDPGDRAQDPDELLGKMLRIDVDGGDPYAIPADNPFAQGGGRPEIYAVGLRNPFRFTFDAVSGDLWVGDVGQDDWEEVSKVELGGNYGWNIMEGYACYSPSVGCDEGGLAIPYVAFPTAAFGGSVMGGIVYRGSDIPSLQGTLLYNDFYAGDIYGLFFDPITGLPAPSEVVGNTGQDIVHYAADGEGEVYLLDYNGEFYKLEPLPDEPVDPFPKTLSETGCFDPSNPREPLEALIPYEVAHSFWSDGAEKRRWMALPDGQTITVGEDGDWEFPVGTVLAKEFEHEGKLIETRLLMAHPDGIWGGYAYAWNDEQTEATLTDGGLVVPLASQQWSIPDSGECNRCHTTVAGSSLGLETSQLNTLFTYESTGRTANQLATLDHIGMFTASPGDPTTLPVFPAPDDEGASLEERARTYLHVNCAQCHQPEGPSRTDLDFRYATSLADTQACDAVPDHGDLGIDDARVIAPGSPERSVLSSRVHRRDAYQMPPLASSVVDEVGAALLDEWIVSLSGCP